MQHKIINYSVQTQTTQYHFIGTNFTNCTQS